MSKPAPISLNIKKNSVPVSKTSPASLKSERGRKKRNSTSTTSVTNAKADVSLAALGTSLGLTLPQSPASPRNLLSNLSSHTEIEEDEDVPGVPQSLRIPSTPPPLQLPSIPVSSSSNFGGSSSLPLTSSIKNQNENQNTATSSTPKQRKSLKESKTEQEKEKEKQLPTITDEEKGDVEKILANSGFSVGEKILTRDPLGHIICHFIKVRDNAGRSAYVELDTDCSDGLGYIQISEYDEIMNAQDIKKQEVNRNDIPYSLKIGTYEANNNDIYGVVFECNNSLCVMSRKNSNLEPVENVFTYEEEREGTGGTSHFSEQPVSFPMIKMSEIMTNPKAVQRSVSLTYNRMVNAVFDNCSKESSKFLFDNLKAVEEQIQRFQNKSNETATALKTRINELENMLEVYERKGIKPKDEEKVRLIKFNLQKRHELMQDHMSLCHNIRSRAHHLKVIATELKEYNDYAENLFQNLDYVFRE